MTNYVKSKVVSRRQRRCGICDERFVATDTAAMCANCLSAKYLIQRAARALMALHGIPKASGLCVDCGARPATHRDHRHYASPLRVDYVCTGCNSRRGPASDLADLIRQHRGFVKAEELEEQREDITAGAEAAPIPAGTLPEQVARFERELINQALTATRHNATKAAQLLGITFRALRYRLEKLGMER